MCGKCLHAAYVVTHRAVASLGDGLKLVKLWQVIAEPLLAVDIRLIYFELLSIVGVLRKRDSVNWLECDEKLPCP